MTKENKHQVHLDQQNHITLFPAKQSLEGFIDDYLDEGCYVGTDFKVKMSKAMKATAEWTKKNNLKGDESEPDCILGVGDGDGDLFVHGSYEAVKRVQNMIFELEELNSKSSNKQSLEEFIREWMNNNAPMDFPKEDFTYQAMKATAEWAKKNN